MQAAKEEAERLNASTPGRSGQPDGHGTRKNVPNKKGKKGGVIESRWIIFFNLN